MRDHKKTIRYQIAITLQSAEPRALTAAEICKRIPGRKPASIGSELNKMLNEQHVIASYQFGPRGGRGYRLGIFARDVLARIEQLDLDLVPPPYDSDDDIPF